MNLIQNDQEFLIQVTILEIDQETAQKALINLQQKVNDSNVFKITYFAAAIPPRHRVTAKVTVVDCTSIYNLIKDEFRLW